MKTTVEKLDPTRAKLTIAVTPEELRPSIDRAYLSISEQIQVPGFRKGKVPAPIIDQRVGRGQIISQAVSESLDTFFRSAVSQEDLRPIGRPEADIETWPEEKDFSGDLVIVVEVDVRPDFDLPKIEGRTVEVPSVEIDDAAVQEELDALRARFGTLVTVERPAATGDFVQLDLVATIDGAEVDTANGISYEIGSGQLLDGMDEAVESLTAGEETTFTSKLAGGDRAGEEAEIAVTVTAVKERELPEANDDFAQMASQFDTIDELREDLQTTVARKHTLTQVDAARRALQDALLDDVELPVPAAAVEAEVHRHLEQENRLEDEEHRAEVTAETEKALRSGMLLDRLAEEQGFEVSQMELSQYIFQMAGQYGMQPAELVQVLQQNGQLQQVMADLTRGKALTWALSQVTVVDDKGETVDVSEFTKLAENDSEDNIAFDSDTDDADAAANDAEANDAK